MSASWKAGKGVGRSGVFVQKFAAVHGRREADAARRGIGIAAMYIGSDEREARPCNVQLLNGGYSIVMACSASPTIINVVEIMKLVWKSGGARVVLTVNMALIKHIKVMLADTSVRAAGGLQWLASSSCHIWQPWRLQNK